MRIYRRTSRAIANAGLIGLCAALLTCTNASSTVAVAIAAALGAAGFLCYGFFIASQHCSQCGASFVKLPENHFARSSWLTFGPLYVPFSCPSCKRYARW